MSNDRDTLVMLERIRLEQKEQFKMILAGTVGMSLDRIVHYADSIETLAKQEAGKSL